MADIFENFKNIKDNPGLLVAGILILGFTLSYIISFIGKLIRFLTLLAVGIILILYYMGYSLDKKSLEKLYEKVQIYIEKTINKNLMENTKKKENFLFPDKLFKDENSSLNLPSINKENIEKAKKALMEILNNSKEY